MPVPNGTPPEQGRAAASGRQLPLSLHLRSQVGGSNPSEWLESLSEKYDNWVEDERDQNRLITVGQIQICGFLMQLLLCPKRCS